MYIEQLCDIINESTLPVSEKKNIMKLVIKGANQYLTLRNTNLESDNLHFILNDCFIEQSEFLNCLGIKVFPNTYGVTSENEGIFGSYIEKSQTLVIFPLSLFTKVDKVSVQERIIKKSK